MQNNRYWSSQHPHLTHGILLQPVKVGVWCAVSARGIAGPMFLTKQLIAEDTQVILGHFLPESTEEERLYG
jgi:hypothetical protein